MAAGVRIVYVRTPAVCFRMHIVLLSIRFYAKVLNSINFSQRVMGYLEIYRIFVPELRRSLHIAKYRNEQKSARFHIVTYIIQANDQLLDFQSKSNLERVIVYFSPLYSIVPQELLYFNPEETSLQQFHKQQCHFTHLLVRKVALIIRR